MKKRRTEAITKLSRKRKTGNLKLFPIVPLKMRNFQDLKLVPSLSICIPWIFFFKKTLSKQLSNSTTMIIAVSVKPYDSY